MRILLSLLMLFILPFSIHAQHGFPEGHWCNTPEGWECQRCRALWGLKNDEKHKVITIPHRGLWGLPNAPESSLHAVQEAYAQGYMFIEIDVILTKDKQLALCHDQQTNRMTDLPKTFSADGNLYDNGSFFRDLNWDTTTDNSVPDEIGISYPSFPALKSGYYVDRFDHLTDYKLNVLQEIYTWCKDKEVVLTLDIKTGSLNDPDVKKEYMEAIALCLQIADSNNMLHNTILKPGSAGQVTVGDLRDYLTSKGQWDNFSKKTNVILINIVGGSFPMATNKEYLDNWFSIPSLVGVEQIYKTSEDELLKPRTDFGGISIIEYTQQKGFRTGVFHPIPTDERGAPGGRGNYFNPANFGTLTDVRGSLEFLFGVPENVFPGMIVTDRPDVDMKFLQLFDLNSKYTKRDSSY